MSLTPAPIETRYKGYRFRSRLEARWAVFFDALGLKWEYEPEGFQTEAGWYLPDFRVHHWSGRLYYVEIKPPGGELGAAFEAFKLAHDSNRGWLDTRVRWFRGDPLSVVTWQDGPDSFIHEAMFDSARPPEDEDGDTLPAWIFDSDGRVRSAATRAREARFEHGETPR